MRTIVVEKGNSDKVVERFGQPSRVDEKEGLIDVHVMVNRRSKESEEIIAMIRWESEEAWKNWEKDPVHIEGHRNKRGQEKPEYVISSTVSTYDVKKVKQGTFGQ
jgi:heme oxygenase (staphylobilin-producing)